MLTHLICTIPNLPASDPSYEIHESDKKEKERSEESQQRNEFGAIKFFHWPTETLRHNVHARNHEQSEKKRKNQSENNCPC